MVWNHQIRIDRKIKRINRTFRKNNAPENIPPQFFGPEQFLELLRNEHLLPYGSSSVRRA